MAQIRCGVQALDRVASRRWDEIFGVAMIYRLTLVNVGTKKTAGRPNSSLRGRLV